MRFPLAMLVVAALSSWSVCAADEDEAPDLPAIMVGELANEKGKISYVGAYTVMKYVPEKRSRVVIEDGKKVEKVYEVKVPHMMSRAFKQSLGPNDRVYRTNGKLVGKKAREDLGKQGGQAVIVMTNGMLDRNLFAVLKDDVLVIVPVPAR